MAARSAAGLVAVLAPDAEIGSHDGDFASAECAGSYLHVHGGETDVTPACGEENLSMLGAVQPHVERSRSTDVGRRPEQVFTDRPVALPAQRIEAGDALVERCAVG